MTASDTNITRPRHAATAAPQTGPQPAEEVILGRYKVLARRGTGGFGTVCTCWDTRLQRRVAIKRIPLSDGGDGRMSASTLDEALREARTACLLAHPNIVGVYDFEVDGAYAYLVMEYVDGLNLAELLQRVEGGTLTHDETAHLLASVTRALSFAHENGVLHLDIKPTNIMIDRQGTVKLTDFGMATLASAAGYGDARGGTVGYMPPEQIRGEVVDERTDVFSLAVVLWQALVGHTPFAADTADASLARITRGPKPSIGQLDPELGQEAADAITSAVSADPAQRMADVTELADSVLPCLGDPQLGQSSLANLLEQQADDEPEATASWSERHLSPLVRFPWLETVFERALASAMVGLVALETLPFVLPAAQGTERAVAAAVIVAATAVWPPLGSMLAGALVVAALGLAASTSDAVPLVALSVIGLVAWWALAGRKDHMATPSVLLGCVLPVPWLGTNLSAWALNPAPAALTSAAGYLFALLYHACVSAGFSARTTAWLAYTLAHEPQTWVFLAGTALAGLAGSWVTCRGSVRAGVAGQVACTFALLVTQTLALRMENGDIWGTADVEAMALALGLCLIMCVACALRGPLEWNQEGG